LFVVTGGNGEGASSNQLAPLSCEPCVSQVAITIACRVGRDAMHCVRSTNTA